jgi:hypothetical protein
MEISQFLKVRIIKTDDESEDILLSKAKRQTAIAMIPLENIYYIQEGDERDTTEIILEDGDIIIAIENVFIIFQLWERWYKNQISSFVSLSRAN